MHPAEALSTWVRRNLSGAWTISNLAGWSLGWSVGGFLGERLGGFYSFAAAAALSTALEWLVLRQIVPKAQKWVTLSVLGMALGDGLSVTLGFPIGAPILVFFQWLFFTRAYRRSVYWLLGGLAGMLAGGAASTSAYLALGGQVGALPTEGPSGPLLGLFLGALFGLIFGASRAFALVRILNAADKARPSVG